MTQQQLKSLITDSLGPIVDEAIRVAGPHPVATNLEVDEAHMAGWSHLQRLRYYIDRARAAGDIPSALTPPGGDHNWPDTDWATIVTT